MSLQNSQQPHFPHVLWILTDKLDVIRIEVKFAVSSIWAAGTNNHGKPYLIDIGTNWYSDEETAKKTQLEMLIKRRERDDNAIRECEERLEKLTLLKQQ